MVRVPKPLKIGTASFLHSEPDHGAQGSSHNPAGSTGTSGKVCFQENDHALTGGSRIWISKGKFVKVVHVSSDVDNGKDDHGPSGCLVERYVLVKWNELVEGCSPKERDEVSTDW